MDLIDQIYQKINEAPLTPKVLLADTYATGNQLLEQLCKRYGAIYNIEVQTLHGIVTAKARLELFRSKISLLEEGQADWVVRLLMKQIAEEDPKSYITGSMLKPGIVSKVYRAILEMRLAGIRTDDVYAEQFTNLDKGNYLKQLFVRYESYLQENRQTDEAGLTEYLKQGAGDILYLAVTPTGWTQMEQSMIDKISGGRLCYLDSEAPFYINEKFSNNRFNMFRATGSLAEIREGFRRILSGSLALDQTEIIVSNYKQYAPIIYSQAETLGVPCTFSNGLPIVFCSAGKAATGILNWIEEGYPVKRLTEMFRHGYMSIADERWSRSDWVRVLEKSGAGWGRERYVALLSPDRMSEEYQEQGTVLYNIMEDLFNGIPEGNEWDPLLLLGWLTAFVQKYVPSRSPDDASVGAALKELNQRHTISPSEPMPIDLAIQHVKELLGSIRIRVSATPQPGAIYVSSLQNGGCSGRERTWIAGIDERAWSIAVVQDPLLLDQERIALSSNLETIGERAKKARCKRESRLSLIRGEVWLSYSSYDTAEQKSQSPAFEMLQILRLQSKNPSLDFGALEHSLEEPHSVMDILHASDRFVPLDEMDAWAQVLRNADGNSKNGMRSILVTYPALAQGYSAQIHRSGEELSAYDGWLEADPFAILEEPEAGNGISSSIVSVSQLEKYASCGLQYYFYYILKLRPKEITEFDRTRWLQARERGTLLHDVFRRYLEEVTDQGKRPAQHNKTRLDEIVETVIRESALSIPAPSIHVFTKECEEIRRDAEVFYRSEVDKTDQPCLFELELTTHNGEPMEVLLSSGIRIYLKGFVDRVDRIGPHEYRIIDYKTGSTSKYKDSDYFCGGTQLQHALYSLAAEQWLRETGMDPEARVVEAEYSFPTERGRGEYVRRTQNRREEMAAIVAKLLESRNSGIYIPTKDSKICQWCDYQAVCGPHSEWMEMKRNSSMNEDVLSRLMEVEGID